MLAANTQLEPCNLYKQHFKPEVFQLLENMKVENSLITIKHKFSYLNDVYQNEPIRSPNLKIHSTEPCNAEPPKELIHKNPITPNELCTLEITTRILKQKIINLVFILKKNSIKLLR